MGPGTVIGGKYVIERVLGEGGMGAVFVAVQEPLGRRVALKIIRGGDIDAERRERFAREATVVAQLRCPHVVTLHDFGEHDGAPYIVMELLEGETLRDRMNRGRLTANEALAFARDLACALRSAHEAGVIHRDVKPENVVLVPDRDRGSIAKLLDFGIVKLAARRDAPGSTRLGMVIGTPGYIAPEAILYGRGDEPSADVYALGVVLYEMLTGRAPFDAPTPVAVMMAHAHEPLPDLVGVPATVATLVRTLMAKEPAERPQNGAAIVDAIDRSRDAQVNVTAARTVASTETSTLTLPSRPSVAVQPFTTLGDGDETFAEGISEDILTALSCFKQLFVVSVNTMIQHGGRDTDPARVARLLGVRYVLQGSVRRAADRVRINAKLVDGSTGAQVWAQRYDRDLHDLFEVQDEVTQSIVACVAGRIEDAHAEVARRKAPHTLAAYDWLARGRALHHRRTREANAEALAAIEKAVEIDPEYAQAHAWRGCIYAQSMFMGVLRADEAMATTGAATRRALELDPNDAECHRLAAEMGLAHNDLDVASEHQRIAQELNPNDARIVALGGEIKVYRGDFEAACEALQIAARLDPLNPTPFLRHVAIARYMQRDLDAAAKILRRIADKRYDMLMLAIAVARLRGDAAETERATQRARETGAMIGTPKKPFADEALRARWREGFERS